MAITNVLSQTLKKEKAMRNVLFVTMVTDFLPGKCRRPGQDPHQRSLTGLPLIPATDSGNHFGNEPDPLPDSQVCRAR